MANEIASDWVPVPREAVRACPLNVRDVKAPGYYWLMPDVGPPFIVEFTADTTDRLYYCGDEVGLAIDGEWSEVADCQLIGPLSPPPL